MKLSKSSLFASSFFFAHCSLIYEFCFIKLNSLLFGGQIQQYNLIVSLFTFSLGLGSILSNKFKGDPITKISAVEFSLFLCALLGPIIILISKSYSISLLFIFLIGVLSGFELPLLLKLGKDHTSSIIGWDYMGMFAAALLFPFIFYRYLGLFPTLLVTATINIAVLLLFIQQRSRLAKGISFVFLFSTIILMISSQHFFNKYSTKLFIEGGL